jgi:hypothetical protein
MPPRDAAARLNARIDAPLAKKVAALRRATRQTTTDVLRVALERYYDAVAREARPYEILVSGGFVGCADGPVELSSTYKAELSRSLGAKHGEDLPTPRAPAAPAKKPARSRKKP